MQQDILDSRFDNIGNMRFFKDSFTRNDNLGTFDRNDLTGILVYKVFHPSLNDITRQSAANGFFQTCFGDFQVFCQTEYFENILIGLETNRTQQSGNGQLFLPVDIGIHHVVYISGKFNPRAPERNNTCRIKFCTVSVYTLSEEHARRTVQLRNDNTFGPIDNKRTLSSHIRDRT